MRAQTQPQQPTGNALMVVSHLKALRIENESFIINQGGLMNAPKPIKIKNDRGASAGRMAGDRVEINKGVEA